MPVCVISQPRYFPGLHYLHRMMLADVFVILDSVQFNPRHEENRTKLKAENGPQWLTVPVFKVCREQKILDTRVNNSQPWQCKAAETLKRLYGEAPCYEKYATEIGDELRVQHDTLTDLDWHSWQPAIRLLGIKCQFVRSSQLPVRSSGWRLLLDICKHVESDVYLSGAFGRDYLDLAAFASNSVEVRFHEYEYPVYAQRYGQFAPFLSYLDMLFNADLEQEVVLAGGKILQC